MTQPHPAPIRLLVVWLLFAAGMTAEVSATTTAATDIPASAWLPAGSLRAACIALCGAAAVGLHVWRTRRIVRAATTRLRRHLEHQSAERTRVSRELHDTLLQVATGLVLNFQVALNRLPRESPERHAMQALLDEVDRDVDAIRTRVAGLLADDDEAGAGRPLSTST